jgi:hypothetical protein
MDRARKSFNHRTPLGDLVLSVPGLELICLSDELDIAGFRTTFRGTVPFQAEPLRTIARSASETERRAWIAEQASAVDSGDSFKLGEAFHKQWATVRRAANRLAACSWLFDLFERGAKCVHVLSCNEDTVLTIDVTRSEVRAWVLHDVRRNMPQWKLETERHEREMGVRVHALIDKALSAVPHLRLRDDTAPGVQPETLWYAFNAYEHLSFEISWRSRLDAHRNRWVSPEARLAEIRDWLKAVLYEFGVESAYHVSVGLRRGTWRTIEVLDPTDLYAWLSDVWQAELHGWQDLGRRTYGYDVRDRIEHLMVLSSDQSRALGLMTTVEDEFLAYMLPTAVLVDRAASRARADTLISQVDYLRSCGHPGHAANLGSRHVFRSSLCVSMLSASTPPDVRARWFRSCLARFDAGTRRTDASTHLPKGCVALYDISLGTLGPVPWTTILVYDRGEWLSSLWDANDGGHLLIRDVNEERVLGLRRRGNAYEACLLPYSRGRNIRRGKHG